MIKLRYSLPYVLRLKSQSSKLLTKRYASTSPMISSDETIPYGVSKTESLLKGISENLSKINGKESQKNDTYNIKENPNKPIGKDLPPQKINKNNEDLNSLKKNSKIKYFRLKDIKYDPIEPSDYLKEDTVKVETPKLAHDLSRVLFQPNVYHQLQDVRSKVYNFTPFLQNIIKVEQFDFNKINLFIPSNRDKKLLSLAKAINNGLCNQLNENKRKIRESGKKINRNIKKPTFIKFYSSTSSMTGILSHFHFALSNYKCPNYSKLSKEFHVKSKQFTQGSTMAAFVVLSKKKSKNTDNDKKEYPVYSIDADKSTDSDQILSIMGNPLEKLLTTNETEFKKYFQRKQNEEKAKQTENDEIPESYHYAKVNKFLIRSQLDCYDPRLPNTGTFDLKTRAVCAIRADLDYIQDVKLNSNNYQIDKLFGKFESHEKEKFDLIRSAMLKYSFQARLGNMDGIFVCYHNLEKIFGFEYLPLTDIDEFYHYEDNSDEKNENNNHEDYSENTSFDVNEKSIATKRAEFEFKASFKILDDILQTVVTKYSDLESLRFVFKAIRNKDTGSTDLYVMYVPLTPKEAQSIQGKQEELIVKEQKEECELIRGILDRNTEVEQKLNIDLRKHRKALQKERFKEIAEITNSKVEGFKISFEYLNKTKNIEVDEIGTLQYNIEELTQQEASKIYSILLKEKAGISWRRTNTSENVDKYIETLRYLSEVVGKQKELNHKKHSTNKVLWKLQTDMKGDVDN